MTEPIQRHSVAIILASLALAATTMAQAQDATAAKTPGWEFARWGMTPAQVRAASHGTVKDTAAGSADSLNGEYVMGQFKFFVDIDYAPRPDDPGNSAEDNLILVGINMNLDPKSGSCSELVAYSKKIFGKPDKTTTQGPLYLDWYKKDIGNDIGYYSWPDKSCGIEYGPLGSS
jgi:hypothetical protein